MADGVRLERNEAKGNGAEGLRGNGTEWCRRKGRVQTERVELNNADGIVAAENGRNGRERLGTEQKRSSVRSAEGRRAAHPRGVNGNRLCLQQPGCRFRIINNYSYYCELILLLIFLVNNNIYECIRKMSVSSYGGIVKVVPMYLIFFSYKI